MSTILTVAALGSLLGCGPDKSAAQDTATSPSDTAQEPMDSGSADTSPPPDTGEPPVDGDDTGADTGDGDTATTIVPIDGLTFELEDATIAMDCEASWTNPSLSGGAKLNLSSTNTDNINLQFTTDLRLIKDGIDGEESTSIEVSPSEWEVEHRTEVRLPVSLSASDTDLSRGCNWCGGSYTMTVTVTDDEGAILSDTAEGTLECTP